jgi:hypothetical protein
MIEWRSEVRLARGSTTAAAQELEARVQEHATGRLDVGAGTAETRVFLVDGVVVAAGSGEGPRGLLRRLAAEGALGAARHKQLLAMSQMASSILGGAKYDAITSLLLDEVPAERLGRALRERLEEDVSRFISSRSTPRFTPDIVAYEPWACPIADTPLLLTRCARRVDAVATLDPTASIRPGPVPPREHDERLVIDALGGEAMVVSEVMLAIPIERHRAAEVLLDMLAAGVARIPGRSFGSDGWEDVTDDLSVDSSRAEESTAPAFDVKPPPSLLVPRDDLDAFAGDGDRIRGGKRGGQFTTEARHLEKVAVEGVETAKRSAYAPRELTDDDVLGKAEVANGVLRRLSEAYDTHRGAGSGPTTIQLLIEGPPTRFIPLFEALPVGRNGAISARDFARNVRKRPAGEQRAILRDGLLDLIERALSRGAEELPAEAFDQMLDQTVGWRQRLGL